MQSGQHLRVTSEKKESRPQQQLCPPPYLLGKMIHRLKCLNWSFFTRNVSQFDIMTNLPPISLELYDQMIALDYKSQFSLQAIFDSLFLIFANIVYSVTAILDPYQVKNKSCSVALIWRTQWNTLSPISTFCCSIWRPKSYYKGMYCLAYSPERDG